MTKTVLILGATGKIGQHAARAFAAGGWTVRRYQRGTNMAKAAAGADVIVNGLNPPNYHDWSTLIPQITKEVIAAAKSSGATVIIPGNVYVYGPNGGVWSEKTQHNPQTRKGRIRAEMEQEYRRAGVPTIILRAGNFIDPDRNGDVMSMAILRSAGRGRITSLGDPSVLQAFAYLPDWAVAAESLASGRADLPVFADIPFAGHAFSMRDLRDCLSREMGRSIRISPFPWWAMRLLSPVWELAREMVEMRPLWNTPHQLDGTRLAELLPDFRPTAMRTVMLSALPPEVHPDQAVRSGSKAIGAQNLS